ncbi:MAG TPA: gliding motility lipoprotein GldH [Chitinophagales bacterium]|nr:gliding motility lipoprotein GldH [Chitinophagales bacterium]
MQLASSSWNVMKQKALGGMLMLSAWCILLLSSCDKSAVMEEQQQIKDYQWEYADAKTFSTEITDTVQHYNIYVSLRHGFGFEWRNVWVKIETTFPDGKQFERRVNLVLSGADGVWHGDCLGDNCDMLIPIQDNAFFPQTGKYTFKISQDMRVNPLPLIKTVGMRIEKYAPAKAQ